MINKKFVFILEDRGVLYINGSDTNEFLQNLITNDIYKVIEELNKGARELGKLTLEEQTKRAERLIAGWRKR